MSFYSDMMKIQKENAIRDGKTSFCLDVVCPYCGEAQEDYHEGLPFGPEEWASLDCEKCGKAYEVKWTAEYHTRKDTIGIVR